MQSMPTSPKAIQIFYSCSETDEDQKWQKKLEQQLSVLKQEGFVSHWHHGLIPAGNEQQVEIDEHLNAAHIFLLLISPDFISSDHCNIEMKKALEKHEKKEARVIPVILRPINWKKAEFSKLQSLPRNGKPVTQWQDPEKSLFHIAEEISSVIDNQVAREWLNYGSILQEIKDYEHALWAFENSLKYDSRYVEAYNRMGDTHYAQRNDEEALKAYESARNYDPRSIWAWYGIGNVSLRQKKNESALDAFQQITTIDPANAWSAWAWYEQGKIQQGFNHSSEALDAYERAIIVGKKTADLALFHREKATLYEKLEMYDEELVEAEKALSLDPKHISSYRDKAHALNKLERFNEALEVCEEAIRRKPNYPSTRLAKGTALKGLGKYQEALREIEEAIRLKGDYMWAWKHKETTLKLLAQQMREEAERYDKLAQVAHEEAKQFGYGE